MGCPRGVESIPFAFKGSKAHKLRECKGHGKCVPGRRVMNKEWVVSKEQGVVPGYIKIGICKECGASVYAPEATSTAGAFKRMSACVCEGGPRGEAVGQRAGSSAPDERVSRAGKKAA